MTERDLARWHVTPDAAQVVPVTAWSTKNRHAKTMYWPAFCPRHFRNLMECMWSVRRGPGYPLEQIHRITIPHWQRMEKTNRRWKYRTDRDKKDSQSE